MNHEEIADRIVKRLFINGGGEVGVQLRLMDRMPEQGKQVYLGGWSVTGVRLQVLEALAGEDGE